MKKQLVWFTVILCIISFILIIVNIFTNEIRITDFTFQIMTFVPLILSLVRIGSGLIVAGREDLFHYRIVILTSFLMVLFKIFFLTNIGLFVLQILILLLFLISFSMTDLVKKGNSSVKQKKQKNN